VNEPLAKVTDSDSYEPASSCTESDLCIQKDGSTDMAGQDASSEFNVLFFTDCKISHLVYDFGKIIGTQRDQVELFQEKTFNSKRRKGQKGCHRLFGYTSGGLAAVRNGKENWPEQRRHLLHDSHRKNGLEVRIKRPRPPPGNN
jgi:hypothetical protein